MCLERTRRQKQKRVTEIGIELCCYYRIPCTLCLYEKTMERDEAMQKIDEAMQKRNEAMQKHDEMRKLMVIQICE